MIPSPRVPVTPQTGIPNQAWNKVTEVRNDVENSGTSPPKNGISPPKKRNLKLYAQNPKAGYFGYNYLVIKMMLDWGFALHTHGWAVEGGFGKSNLKLYVQNPKAGCFGYNYLVIKMMLDWGALSTPMGRRSKEDSENQI